MKEKNKKSTFQPLFSRRTFVASLGAMVLMPKKLFAASKADFDESLAVFLSDVHVNGLDELNGKKRNGSNDSCRRTGIPSVRFN